MPTAQTESGWGQTEETTWEGGAEAGWTGTNSPAAGGGAAGWGTDTGASHWTSWGHPPAGQHATNVSRPAQYQPSIVNSVSSHPGNNKVPFGQQQYNKSPVAQAIPAVKFQQPAQNMYQQPAQWGSTWDAGIPEEDEDGLSYADEEEEYGYPEAQPQHQGGYFPSASSHHQSSPSKTLFAALGSPDVARPFGLPPSNIHSHRLIESQGAALSRAHKAFYAQERLAKDRIHWSFPPDKDERVSSLLRWIEGMSEAIGALGVSGLQISHCGVAEGIYFQSCKSSSRMGNEAHYS